MRLKNLRSQLMKVYDFNWAFLYCIILLTAAFSWSPWAYSDSAKSLAMTLVLGWTGISNSMLAPSFYIYAYDRDVRLPLQVLLLLSQVISFSIFSEHFTGLLPPKWFNISKKFLKTFYWTYSCWSSIFNWLLTLRFMSYLF